MNISKEDIVKLYITKRNQYILDKFINEYADKNISDIRKYLKKMIDMVLQSSIPNKKGKYTTNICPEKENIVKKIFSTIVYTERYNNSLNDTLFKKPDFINATILKIEEFTYYNELNWGKQFITELQKIRSERFPDIVFPNSIYQVFVKNIRL